MNVFKLTIHSLAVVSVLGFVSTADANTRSQVVHGGYGSQYNDVTGRSTYAPFGEQLLGSSSTASFFFKKGVGNFDRGNFDKANQAFRAVLRADGSTGLDALTLRYLIYINQQQGNEFASEKYKQAYLKLAEM